MTHPNTMFDKEKIQLGISANYILNQTDRFWMVISGDVDLFYVRIDENGEYQSALNHVYRISQGELLFNFMLPSVAEDFRLVATSSEATLLAINKNKLFDINKTVLKQFIDKWILKTSGRLSTASIPRVYKALDETLKITLQKEEIAYPFRGLKWATLFQGTAFKYGGVTKVSEESEHHFPFAVSNSLWIQAQDKPAQISIMNTIDVLRDEIFFMLSFQELQQHFCRVILE